MKRKSKISSETPRRIVCGMILVALIIIIGSRGGDLGYSHKIIKNQTENIILSSVVTLAVHH